MVQQLSEQVTRLVRDELHSARDELSAKAKHAGIGAGMFGGAGVVGLYGVAALLTTLILVLALVMPAWVAALIVSVGLFAAAGVMALTGRSRVRRVGSIMPEQTIESVKADVRTVSHAVHEGRHQ
nr:phage holin family protein [Planosporangium mesophilum]